VLNSDQHVALVVAAELDLSGKVLREICVDRDREMSVAKLCDPFAEVV